MKIENDDSVFSWLLKDVRNTFRDPEYAKCWYEKTVDVKIDDVEIYFPAGLWCVLKAGPGRPFMSMMPAPHHPMEALSSQRGYGGCWPKAGEKVKHEDLLHAASSLRRGLWHERMEEMGGHMFLTPAQARFIGHLFTPRYAAYGWEGMTEALLRTRLYAAAGLKNPERFAFDAARAAKDDRRMIPREALWAGIDLDENSVVRI